MKGSSYRDRDHAFGQAMLTLRTAIGLTQVGLADLLGVSRRAVGDWEAGSSYPKAEHLKQFVALAIEHRAFPAGREADEVRAFWQAARQKVLLDEAWVAALLAQMQTPSTSQPIEAMSGTAHGRASPAGGPRVDWGDALAVPTFYGREWELNLLIEWVVVERCRVVSVLGLGGIGKSALAVSLMHRVAEQFEVVIWRSLRDLPTCEVLLDDLLQVLAPQAFGEMPASFERRLHVLLEQLRSTRILLVLDNLESVLEDGEAAGRMRPGYEGFGRFLRQSAQTEHQSCVLLTSREKPGDLVPLEGSRSPVRVLRLARLEMDACEALLAEKDVVGTAPERARLIEAYGGNPLALKIVAQTIVDLFDGKIAPFLAQGEVIFGGIRELLDQQFNRLSALEQSVLLWLAILREPSSLDELVALLVTPLPRARLLEAVGALRRRSLIERGQTQGSFTLQSVVLEYVTARLIGEAVDEIREMKLARLLAHSLELAQAREYVRQTQERLLVAPVLAHLRGGYPQEAGVEAQLLALLTQLATRADDAQGYGPANLVALLRLQRGDLCGLDLSRLALRGVYLQGVEMQGATLSGAMIQDSIFTETFDAVSAVAISPSGAYWAAATLRGEVWVREAAGQRLHLVWQAHPTMIRALAFSPDGSRLASGTLEGMIRLWDVASGGLLWSSWHTTNVNSLTFALDGSLLASGGNDATVRFWDPQNGTLLETLPHLGPVFAVTWSPDGQLLASADYEGRIRLWVIQGTQPATCIQVLAGHAKWVRGLAFSPDSRLLASGSNDGTVKLWEVANGSLRQTLTGHTDPVETVAWSPDGRTLASSGLDRSIWLWDVEHGSARAVLQGHSAPVYPLAFTPDSGWLLSGSDDGTLRVWDVVRAQPVRVIQGYAPTLFDVDWSPDGTQVVSGGTGALVTLWDVSGKAPPRVMRGHNWRVFGVGWSPDGRLLASSGWDSLIRVWDPTSGASVDMREPDTYFYGIAWSPDGKYLASGTYLHGVLVWDVTARTHRWLGREHPTRFPRVAWSPDGKQLAGGADDGHVYLWEAFDGMLQQRLTGHQGMIQAVAWSPDGTRLASAGSGREDGELFVWDPLRGERVGVFTGHPGPINAVSWGPSASSLISGGADGTLRWWEVQSGECVLVRQAHQGAVLSIRRSADGTKLASCGADDAIMLWDLQTGEHLQTLRRDRPYERLNITGIRGLTEVQKETLRALGAIEEGPMQGTYHTP